MKKSFSILLLILSFCFVTNVNAGEYIIESTKPFKAPLITDVYKKYNKYYFYNAHVLGWGDMLITYEDGKDLKRFKGLGEMEEKDLRLTCMNLENQRAVKITSKDVKEARARLANWHSKKEMARAYRKNFMMEYIPDIQDIST